MKTARASEMPGTQCHTAATREQATLYRFHDGTLVSTKFFQLIFVQSILLKCAHPDACYHSWLYCYFTKLTSPTAVNPPAVLADHTRERRRYTLVIRLLVFWHYYRNSAILGRETLCVPQIHDISGSAPPRRGSINRRHSGFHWDSCA